VNREGAMAVNAWIVGLIGVLIAILVGVALLAPIQTTVNDTYVDGGAGDALLDLLPLLVVIAIVLVVVFWAMGSFERSGGGF